MKPQEYDVVRATRTLTNKVVTGTTGTILMIFSDPRLAYLIEFIDQGETLDIVTVEPEDIEVVTRYVDMKTDDSR